MAINNVAEMVECIAQTVRAALPELLNNDVKENIRSLAQDIIADLDVVTREELTIQTTVLQKMRAKIDEMKAMITELEKRLQDK